MTRYLTDSLLFTKKFTFFSELEMSPHLTFSFIDYSTVLESAGKPI